MNQAQKDALRPRNPNDTMTVDEAKHILNWFYGSAPIRIANGAMLSRGVIEAIELLGGRYQSGWGVTKLPQYTPFDEI